MILPILSYGHTILNQECKEIDKNYPNLKELIDNMWETLYPAEGAGLAAPQVDHNIKLFIVDTVQIYKNYSPRDRKDFFDGDKGVKETFINAKITEYSEEVWSDYEGCLSLPLVSGEVERSWGIKIEYYDKNFNKKTKEFKGASARAIQHEYDHTIGKLYIDRMDPIKKSFMKMKLRGLSESTQGIKYLMKFV